MGKSIYTYYKERLVEIGGNNKCLYLKNVVRKSSYDIGRILEGRDKKVAEFIEFLWYGERKPLTIISNKEKNEILQNLDVQTRIYKRADERTPISKEDAEKLAKLQEKDRKNASAKAIEAELVKLKELKREEEEIERETGRYELYIGYPFVFGMISQGFHRIPIKAPLLLFPVKIDIEDDETVEIRFNNAEKIQINKALVFAYAQSKKMNIDN